jgi:hypothetical protein
MCDVENQDWLDALYAKTLSMSFNSGGYYGNSLKLLSLLTISGNYWVPACDNMNGIGFHENTQSNLFTLLQNTVHNDLELELKTTNKLKLQIIDIQGHSIINDQTQEANYRLNLNSLPIGIYIIKAQENGSFKSFQTERFIKI